MQINHVAVVGSGTMGNGIAHVFAASGFDVALIDVDRKFLDRALATIRKNLERQAAKGRLPPALASPAPPLLTPPSPTSGERGDGVESILARIKTSTRLEDAAGCGLALEAVPENLALKAEIFRKLDAACGPESILATNTSSIPIARLASATKRPAKVVGMHFMNPVPVMKLVEIIRGAATSEETYRAVRDLTLRLGKTPVTSADAPGFISNRVLMPMINEAVWALHEGVATAEDVDMVMRLGMNHPMGPLTLADYIGLDTCLSILRVLEDGFKNPKYAPCPLLVRLVGEGKLGRKSGQGFYEYPPQKAASGS